MSKPTIEFCTPQASWQRTDSFGIEEQILAADPMTGDKTLIQRYEPGTETPLGIISHDFWEEVLLLSGDLTDVNLGQTFTAGMFACRPPGMEHGPYRSESGCSMMVNIRH